jgi:ABC-type thiamin/hydroxymethylpyrimidine transport system permease subunit
MSVIGESDKFQVSDLAIMVVMPIILAVVMVWYPTMAKKRGWLS